MAAEYLLTEATPASPVTSYLTNDTLGSPRVITDSSGNITSRRDFMPFGEEISAIGGRTSGLGYQLDATRQKFTGYERDNETDLDFAQARMYANKLGRFSTTDPLMASAKMIRPESWNRYVYCYNNPLTLVDLNGMDVQLLDEKARQRVLSTLPEALRKKVEKQIDKNGLLKKGTLDKIASKDANFKDLKALVNSARTVEVITSNKDSDGKVFYFQSAESQKQASIESWMKDGLTKEQAEEEIKGLEFSDNKGLGETNELANGNIRVTISDATGLASTAPVGALAGATGHELYGHALSAVEGKPWFHEYLRDEKGQITGHDTKGPLMQLHGIFTTIIRQSSPPGQVPDILSAQIDRHQRKRRIRHCNS